MKALSPATFITLVCLATLLVPRAASVGTATLSLGDTNGRMKLAVTDESATYAAASLAYLIQQNGRVQMTQVKVMIPSNGGVVLVSTTPVSVFYGTLGPDGKYMLTLAASDAFKAMLQTTLGPANFIEFTLSW